MDNIRLLSGISPKSVALAKAAAKILARDFNLVEDSPDLLVVVGGDGTLLHWLRQLGYPRIPVLGVDGGSLGFFQELAASDLERLPDILKRGEYRLQKLPLLKLVAGDHKEFAFNEFVIERASARSAHLSLALDGHKFEKFIGDGIIAATPQGSTAYASAAGGAVLPYGLAAYQVVPSNPHDSALYKALNQPLVLPASTKLEVSVLDGDARPVRIMADGQEVAGSSSLTIELAKQYITMLRTPSFNYYERLSHKIIG